MAGCIAAWTDRSRSGNWCIVGRLANEAAGITGGRAGMSGAGGAGDPFKQRDKNNDGKLDREELPGAMFDRLDANKDGFVTEDELKALWKTRP